MPGPAGPDLGVGPPGTDAYRSQRTHARSASSALLEHDGAGIVASSSHASKRTSKACEFCRARKRKCDGKRPCSHCVRLGKAHECKIRLKARPNRPPPPSAGAPSTHADSSLPALVEAHLRAHLESQGVYIDLSLPEVPPLQPLPAGNIPLPGDPASWAESLSTAVQCCSHHLDIFPPGRVALVIATFETRTTELDTDEMILVLALLAVGRQIELALLRDRACDDANVFFLLAMRTLDEWGQCSLLALGALHLLHFFALRHGSKTDFEQVLDRLTEHCLQLGLHHKSTVSLYPTDDSPGRLFYLTMWYATLVGSPPSFALGSYDPTWLTTPDTRFGHQFEESALSLQFCLLENEAMGVAARPGGYGGDASGLADLESRLAAWQRLCGVERKGQSPFLAFALIRYHWLRLLLRFPLLSAPATRLASLALLARSSTALLRIYTQLSSTVLYIPKWADSRRMSTAGYVALVCHLEGELDMDEMRSVSEAVVELWRKSVGLYPPARALFEAWRGVMRSIGIDVPVEELNVGAEDDATDNFRFDYTLPPES